MWGGENVTFSRDTEVIEIPAGTRLTVPAGTKALITLKSSDIREVGDDDLVTVRPTGASPNRRDA